MKLPYLATATAASETTRRAITDRAALAGILTILDTGTLWEMLPQEMHCGYGMTCLRRLRDWQAAGAWDKLQGVLHSESGGGVKIHWTRAAVASSSIRAVGGAEAPDPIRLIVAG